MPILTYISKIPLYSTRQEALSWGFKKGIKGYHTHEYNGGKGYMAGWNHKSSKRALKLDDGRNINSSKDPITMPSRYTPVAASTTTQSVDEQISEIEVTTETYDKANDLVNKKLRELKEALDKIKLSKENIDKLIKESEGSKDIIRSYEQKIKSIELTESQIKEQFDKTQEGNLQKSVNYITQSYQESQEPNAESNYIVEVEAVGDYVANTQSILTPVTSSGESNGLVSDKELQRREELEKTNLEAAKKEALERITKEAAKLSEREAADYRKRIEEREEEARRRSGGY